MDADAVPPGHEKQWRALDAFVPIGDRVITCPQSQTMLAAEYSGGPAVLILAVIWHEMAHAEGLDERRGSGRRTCGSSSCSGLVDSAVGRPIWTNSDGAGKVV